MNAECQPLLKQLISATTEYSRLIATSGAQEIEKSAERFSAKRLILILCSLGAVAAAIVLATLIHRSLMRSLGAAPDCLARSRPAGGFRQPGPVPGAATAPANSVLASLGDMQTALADIVSRVRASSHVDRCGFAGNRLGQHRPLAPHRAAGQQPAAKCLVHGRDDRHGQAKRRHGAAGQPARGRGTRGGRAWRHGGQPRW